MELKTALPIASDLVKLLAPDCEKINIAGSCLREKNEVKDIEIVCLPKTTIMKDMFGWDEGVLLDFNFQKKVESLGKIIKGRAEGKYIQIELPKRINLDLFMPEENDYYRQLAIRTGSSDYSYKVIAHGWNVLGWVGTEKGLRRKEDCQKIIIGNGQYKWKIVNENGQLPPIWKSEEEFFEWIKIKWIEPRFRL